MKTTHLLTERAILRPDNPQGLTQIKDNLYRHTTGAGLAVHSGFVLITTEGALVIDPAMTRSSIWLLNEIKTRFHVPVKYEIRQQWPVGVRCRINRNAVVSTYTHAHADHISGGQIFQQDGAIVIANRRMLNNKQHYSASDHGDMWFYPDGSVGFSKGETLRSWTEP